MLEAHYGVLYAGAVLVALNTRLSAAELAYSGLADLSASFPVESFTEFEQTPDGAWAVAREYKLTGPPH